MRLVFRGVRGSTPAPGADFVRYGGHTSCVTVAHDAAGPPALILDAGTGIRTVSPGSAFHGSILLSHLHWDHMQGIPFFAAGDRPDARVEVLMPAEAGRSGRDLMAQAMSPPAFPITPEGLQGAWSFRAIEPGVLRVQGFDLTAFEVAHKGGRAFGYRVQDAGAAVAYVPDHAPWEGVGDPALTAMAGADVLIHDAQFLDREAARAHDYGHATITEALDLARRVGVGRLVLYHHGPARADDALDRIATEHPEVVVAHEGLVLDLP
jgi:ribonuclease BN (tRNA processing enzyme)